MHHKALGLVAILVATTLAWGQGADRPTILKPKEAADGWLQLFDGETTFGWRLETGDVKVIGGELVVGGDKETKLFLPIPGFGEGTWQSRHEGKDAPKFVVQSTLTDRPPSTASSGFSGVERNGKSEWVPGEWSIVANPSTISTGVQTSGSFDSNKGAVTVTKFTAGASARVASHLLVPAGTKLFLKDVKFKPTGLQPIFNGKDLTGWKEIPDKKSKFSVTPEGWLNVKDGQGDLQTEGQWDDFILQMEVISNGKHLNSGIFFRCLPGEFWSGYEAQIRNEWTGDDRTKPVDYGTGAIYRRQAARRVVSSDNEWFTLTVLAQGNRLATWVNGYQVADFTDTRPMDRSGRNGQKLDKGPISIQGHDATTDLSFRNVKIVELPK